MRLVAEDLACLRGGRTVFDGVSFAIGPGGALAVTGRNGAGKSSLLRLVAGLVPVAAGSLRLDGRDPDRSLGEHMHYAGHADALKPALTALENLSFWRALYGEPWLEPQEALERLAIAHLADLPAGYLSAGQKRRLTLARLFVNRRPIWLLDEPTSAIDALTQARFAALARQHLDEGGLLMAATHGELGITATAVLEMSE
jgi:heme exporter protein A